MYMGLQAHCNPVMIRNSVYSLNMYMGLQVHCNSLMTSIQFLGYVMTFVTVGIVILTAVILLWIITPDVCELLHTDES